MAKFIIDVSQYQGIINWEQVKGHIDGAILRCGYGDDIASQDDRQWKRNADECTRLGIPFGVYIYSYATSMAQAESEAQHVLRCVKGYRLSYPIYLDLEQAGTESGAIERANRFGDIIEAAGYWCGVYANLSWWNNYLRGLDRFTKWVAQYNSTCDYKGQTDIWQYSSAGSVPGISGGVDVNHCYRDFQKEITGGSASEKPIQSPGDAKNNSGLWYRAHVEDFGWLDAVHDGQVSGTTGKGKRLEAIKIDTRKLPGVKLKVTAHIQDIGNVDYGYIDHNTIIGTVGKKKRLEAVHIIAEGLCGKKIYTQAHFDNDGWAAPVQGGDTGTYGLSKEMQAIRIWIQ